MNAAIQMLRSVPQFKEIISSLAANNVFNSFIQAYNNPSHVVGSSLKNVIRDLDTGDVTPKMFVAMFLNSNP